MHPSIVACDPAAALVEQADAPMTTSPNALEVAWNVITGAVGKQQLQDSAGIGLESESRLWKRFTDVLQLVPSGAYCPDSAFAQKRRRIFAEPTVLYQRCLTHGHDCPLPYVDYDHSGLPCTDNSRSKHGRAFFEGQTGPMFAVWALRLRRCGVKLAILENTVDLQIDVLDSLLIDMYDRFQIFVNMADCGHSAVSRPRTYIIYALSGQYDLLFDPRELYQLASKAVKSMHSTKPRDYLSAPELEVQLEAMESCRQRGLTYVPGWTDLSYVLNQRERRVVEELDALYMKAPDALQASLLETYQNRGRLGHYLDYPGIDKFTKLLLDGQDCFSVTLEDGRWWLSNGENDLELTKEAVPDLPATPLELVA
ncbi:unnamed protein product [Symbiodinium sp. CCMP2592]|nr:unnamed protein product [Symbiodinium sp. CCMP2592]